MNGRDLAFLVGGIAVGWLITLNMAPANTDDCCRRVADAVRDKVADKLGDGFAELGDEIGLWKHTPGWLDALGL